MLRIQKHVPFPARNDRRNHQHGRSPLADPGIAEVAGRTQVRMIPPGRQAALILSLDTYRGGDGDLDCHVRLGHAPDTGVGQTLQHGARIGPAGIDDAEAG